MEKSKNRPEPKTKVRWRNYDCIIQRVKRRDMVAKLKPDYDEQKPMPYDYFWVDFNEIGY